MHGSSAPGEGRRLVGRDGDERSPVHAPSPSGRPHDHATGLDGAAEVREEKVIPPGIAGFGRSQDVQLGGTSVVLLPRIRELAE